VRNGRTLWMTLTHLRPSTCPLGEVRYKPSIPIAQCWKILATREIQRAYGARTMRNLRHILHHSLLLLPGATALSAEEWRKQSIYQVVTDRFARTDLSTTAACRTADQIYCGGTWRGLISKLDYIQGMGFTSVWISPVVKQIDGYSPSHG
jgi:hypothetical protein